MNEDVKLKMGERLKVIVIVTFCRSNYCLIE